MTSLFEPTRVGAIEVKNRLFMAPLTRNRATPEGLPGPLAAEYYSQRASGGLLIAEAAQINPMGQGYLNTPGIYNDAQAQGWKIITDAVHDKGGKICLQLWHVGRISHTSLLPDQQSPVAPSAIRANSQTFTASGMVDVSEPRALTTDEIRATVADYKQAALHAKNAGFDCVEVHAANGYLIDQFLQDKTNQRTDEYGGSVENRTRFLMDVVEAVVSVWGADRTGVRLSPTGTFNDMSNIDPLTTYGTAIEQLNSLKLAYLHMVERLPGIASSDEEQQVLRQLRAKWDGFYIANGDYLRERAEQVVSQGYANAIAFGRAFLANPDLPLRLQENAPLNEADTATFYGGGAKGYTDYPYLTESVTA